ncbi:hypothetical protein KA005_33100 [bacterium]|nr:hypothetical protein [bacterium]
MALEIIQNNKRREMEDYWDWELYIKGDWEELKEIEYVEYTLHETFPNPIRRKYNSKDGFKLKTAGWGEFTVFIRVHYKENINKKDEYIEEYLQLSY